MLEIISGACQLSNLNRTRFQDLLNVNEKSTTDGVCIKHLFVSTHTNSIHTLSARLHIRHCEWLGMNIFKTLDMVLFCYFFFNSGHYIRESLFTYSMFVEKDKFYLFNQNLVPFRDLQKNFVIITIVIVHGVIPIRWCRSNAKESGHQPFGPTYNGSAVIDGRILLLSGRYDRSIISSLLIHHCSFFRKDLVSNVCISSFFHNSQPLRWWQLLLPRASILCTVGCRWVYKDQPEFTIMFYRIGLGFA